MADKFDMELHGANALSKILKELPITMQARIRKTGIRKGASKYRTLLRRDAPRQSGEFRKSLTVRPSKKWPYAWIGLHTRYYYKLLDMTGVTRAGKYHVWFVESAKRHAPTIAKIVIKETKTALFNEAGKSYARSKRSSK